MFGWFSKKTEVQKLIDRVGMEQAVEHYAEIVSRRLPNVGVFRQFLLEELDAAQHGNAEAQAFVRSTGIPASEYNGAMRRSRPEVDGPDGPQQALVRICQQLGDDPVKVARFRIAVVQSLLRNATTEDPNAPAPKAPVIRTTDDVVRLIKQQGAAAAGVTLRKLADEGNLICQMALSQIMLQMLDKEKFAKNIPGHVHQHTQEWKDCERYTRLAAEQGDPASQFALGKLYFDAIDISGDVLRAADAERMGKSVRWNRKAAAQGHKPSIEQLQWFDEYFPNIVKVVDAQDAAGMDVRF